MFSQTAEYALRAVVFIAESGVTRCTTQTIAETTQIPPRYLAKVLHNLATAGVLIGQRGVNGGFRLARDPAAITVLDVIRAVEPLKRILRCPLNLEEHRHALCPLHSRLDESLALIEDNLRQTTIGNLLHRPTFRKAV